MGSEYPSAKDIATELAALLLGPDKTPPAGDSEPPDPHNLTDEEIVKRHREDPKKLVEEFKAAKAARRESKREGKR